MKKVGVTLKESVSLPFVLYHSKNIGYHWNHFMLLKLDDKMTNFERLKFSVKLKSCFEGPQNCAKLRWSSEINFSHLRNFKLISLPGQIYEATLEMGSMFVHGKLHLKNTSLN